MAGNPVVFVNQSTEDGEGPIVRVSTGAKGAQGNAGSGGARFSSDGTKIVFASVASNFVGGDTNGAKDIFVKDLATGAITLVSRAADGTKGNGDSLDATFSPDGTKVAFISYTSNLVPGDTNGVVFLESGVDIFVKDLTTGAITRVSTAADGAESDGGSVAPVFSPDGTKIAFSSAADNLVPGDTNGAIDVFVKDLNTGAITRVSTAAGGTQADDPVNKEFGGHIADPVFSPDGTKIAFVSTATNLVPGDTNNQSDLFIKDLNTGAISRISGDNDQPYSAVFSPDGAKVAFLEDRLNPSTGATQFDIFIKDLTTGALVLASTGVGDVRGNADSYGPVFSADGKTLAFTSLASNLVPGDTNGKTDIFVKDLTTGAIGRVSTAVAAVQGDGDSAGAVFSPDGKTLMFSSTASNLLPNGNDPDVFEPGDSNGASDVFIKTLTPPVTATPIGAVTDDASKAAVFTTGTLLFQDADLADTHTLSSAPQAGDIGTLSLSLTRDATGGKTGFISWGYQVSHAAAAYLAAGQTKTDTFSVAVDDGHGNQGLQTVSVTVTGVDDAPTLALGDQTAPLVEAGLATAGNATASIAVQAADLDQGDVATFDTRGWTFINATHVSKSSIYGTAVLDTEAGTLNYTLDNNKIAADALSQGQSVTDSFAVTAFDNYGGSVTKTGSFAITGSNDAPVFVSSPPSGYVGGLGTVTRASAASDGAQSDNGGDVPSVSADGTKVAFWSHATDLVANTTVAVGTNVFVKDLTTGSTTLVSAAADGTPGNGPSDGANISRDGKFVAFNSAASNLFPGNTNDSVDVFIKNLATGAITRVSASSNPNDQGAISVAGNFSSDGTKLVFESAAHLTPDDTSPYTDVYVYDLKTGTTTLVSTNGNGVQANFNSLSPVLSLDGTKVAFSSNASNLSPLVTNTDQNIYIKDLTTGAVSIASSRTDGTPSEGFNFAPAFSPDGTKVVFWSDMDDLVPDDTNFQPDIFVKDLKNGALTRVSTAANGAQADGGSSDPNWSPDGTKIIFTSSSDNLVPGGSNVSGGLYVKDLLTGEVTRVSTAADGSSGNSYSDHAVISANGAVVAFRSAASNLVIGDTNGIEDVFVKNLQALIVSSPTGQVADDGTKASVSTTGHLLFSGPDAGDTHTVTVTAAAGNIGTLAAPLTKNAGVGTTGIIDWTYQVSHQAASAIAKGADKVDRFTVKVDDGLGGVAEQVVTVTVLGSTVTVPAGVTQSGIALEPGDTLVIAPGATVLDPVVPAGATVRNDGIIRVTDNGTVTEAGAITGSGAVVMAGSGKLVLSGANTFSGGTIVKAGTVEFTTPASAGSGPVTFAAPADPLVVIDAAATPVDGAFFGNIIDSLGDLDAIDLQGLPYDVASSAATLVGAAELDVTNGSKTVKFTLAHAGSAQYYTHDDGTPSHGTLIDNNPPCYCRGTLILTGRGEVAVEALAVGDLAVTASGERRPIVWVGHRAIDITRHPEPEKVWPVRVEAGAFGDNRPSRDLWMSPGHKVGVDGVLIPVKYLLNGRTVAQVPRNSVEYWHVELDRHDILLAENLPAESYLDTGNRTAFANGGAFLELHPDFEPKRSEDTCAPLVKAGPPLVRAKAALLARAKAFGDETTTEADLHVMADGRRFDPIRRGATRFVFVLPPHRASIALRSRTSVPAETQSTSTDTRRLGVCVKRLQVDGKDVALNDDARLGEGWHRLERRSGQADRRWTKGHSPIPAGTRLIVLDLAKHSQYWTESMFGDRLYRHRGTSLPSLARLNSEALQC